MKRILTYKIDEKNSGKTIEKFLKEQGYSHAVMVALKKTEYGITRNGKWAYTNEKLNNNDKIQTTILENEFDENIEPIFLPLDIIFEDDDLLVINKAANMPIHPSMKNHDNTLANAILDRLLHHSNVIKITGPSYRLKDKLKCVIFNFVKILCLKLGLIKHHFYLIRKGWDFIKK